MQFISAEEKAALEKRLQELYRQQVEVHERIRAAAALGDITDNADYRWAKDENQRLQREVLALEEKLRNAAVVSNDAVPDGVVFLGHTVKLLDLSDDSEQLVRIVGEVQHTPTDDDVLTVSASSPMGEALLKSRVGDTVRVRAPAGMMEFKILQII